ncbi:MAG: hypothetical protein H6747_11060 [Deltaproteobacteria bacterium]|nr:hypothetical protein [Deltaproteobacteria bacterium]
MPSALKLHDDIVEAARAEAPLWSRSTTQQVEHWARIGRAIERERLASADRVRAALSAQLDFDALDGDERALVLASLEEEIVTPHGDAGLAAELAHRTLRPSYIDSSGKVVRPGDSEAR